MSHLSSSGGSWWVSTETRTRLINGAVQELVTRHTYDAAGKLLRSVAPDGVETPHAYTADGQLLQETVAGRVTTYTYDGNGRVINVQAGMAGETLATVYDEEGNVTKTTDALGLGSSMVYDAANRLVETIHDDDTPVTTTDNPRTQQAYYKDGQLKYRWDGQ